MKKSLLALAVLGAYAGVASAQSSVTLYGTLDVAGRYVKADGLEKRTEMATDGINSSQLGFRGVEDLGGGLKAGFTLLAGVNPNNGTSNDTNSTGKFWNRRSTVSLFGNFGEVRLGRDYTPDFWNLTIFDAFGTNGIGSSLNVRGTNSLYAGTRRDNSIGYFLPSNLGGFYGQVMVASGWGTTSGGAGQLQTADRFGRYWGLRGGFAAGPFDVALAYAEQKLANGVPLLGINQNESQKSFNVGGSFDFGFLKLMGYYDHQQIPNSGKNDQWSISGVFPFGQSEVHLGYDWDKIDIPFNPNIQSNTIDQFKATYQYNLSKRTAVYSTAAFLKNHDRTSFTLPGTANGLPDAGGKSSGIEFGIRHFF